MLPLLALQVFLPLVLVVGWIWIPARRPVHFTVRVLSTSAVLLALALAGLWTSLPGFLPWVLALLGIVCLGVRAKRRSALKAAPRPFTTWAWTSLYLVFGLVGLVACTLAVRGRQLPPVDSVDIPLPFQEGLYLVVNGGSTELLNAHMKTLDESVPRFQAYRGQSYGVDLVRIDRWGFRASGWQPSDPSEYAIFGTPVFAPCDGTVLAARNDRPDMPVPRMDLEVFEGNHVLLDGGDFQLLLAHFQAGTVRVQVGDEVSQGDLLGHVGNSGRSGEPHLHCSAQRPGTVHAPFSGEPLFLTIDGRVAVRNHRLEARP